MTSKFIYLIKILFYFIKKSKKLIFFYQRYKFFVVFDGNIKALCLANLDSDINDIEIFEFLSNILKKLFTKYTYEFLESAPNYSLREFVDVLKNEMKDFHKIKKKFKKDKKGLDFSFYSNEEMKQTFLNKSLGLFIFLFLF